MAEDPELEQQEYFENAKGASDGPMGRFRWSNYGAADGARWHPAMFRPGSKEGPRAGRIPLIPLVLAVVLFAAALGVLIALNLR